jgi:radical SAM superfamily enzyme YgiQ (UPF0313 family)
VDGSSVLPVVRTASAWFLAPPDGIDPVPATADDIIERLRSGGATAPIGTSATAGLPAHWFIEPVPAFVGLLDGGEVLVEGTEGRQHRLGPEDVVLLDALGSGGLVGDVGAAANGPGGGEAAARLAALAEIGLLTVYAIDLPAAEDAGAAGDPEAPVRRRPPWLRAVARVVRRGLRSFPTRQDQPPSEAPAGRGEPPSGHPPEGPPTQEAAATHTPEGTGGRDEEVVYLETPAVGPVPAGAVPVYAVFKRDIGPALSLGMLTAAARHHADGALNRSFQIRRPEDPSSFLADLAAGDGPAIMLCSNYIWSVEHNLEVARQAAAIRPGLVVIHGGPSTPKYEEDCRNFFTENPGIVHVAVRSEGEQTLVEILAALADGLPGIDLSRLAEVPGLTYLDPASGAAVRTDDRDRIADLNQLPSPYLTGEYDHLDPSAWRTYVTFETNRGCPYGCTFCDWGSSTLSRIRKFDLDRVAQEFEWAGRRQLETWVLGDANTGIMSRDVDLIQRLTEVKQAMGVPSVLGFNVAKNTTKHLTKIVDLLVGADVAPYCTLALQTRDEDTLDAVARNNISTEHYVALAASFRRRLLPLQADLMLGLPGQTLDSLTGDLQFLIDHEVPARIWITQMLPNSPMNEPEYRERWKVQTNGSKVVMSTASFSVEERAEMMRLRHAYTVFERYGLLRHVTRYLQWDAGLPATALIRRIMAVTAEEPERFPLLNFAMRYFDFYPLPPVGWSSFLEEVRRFLAEEHGIGASPGLDTVLAVQEALLPVRGRALPAVVPLAHDYAAYYADATRNLWFEGSATGAVAPLASYPAGELEVLADRTGRCSWAMRPTDDPRDETMNDTYWLSGHMELDSVLVRNYPEIATGDYQGVALQVPEGVDRWEEQVADAATRSQSNVRLRTPREGTAASA